MHSFKSDEFKIRVLTKDDAEEYNALLRYAFQVTEADLAETGWKDDEIKQSKFPVLERADVLGCFNIIDNKEELVAQFAVYPLDMNIYGERYEVGFVTSVCTYPEYTGHGLMKKLMRCTFCLISNVPENANASHPKIAYSVICAAFRMGYSMFPAIFPIWSVVSPQLKISSVSSTRR